MEVLIASHNPVKIRAVKSAFSLHFPGTKINFMAHGAESGVSGQPRSDEETRRGARNRAADTRSHYPLADFWVGLEGGIEPRDGRLMAFAWMVVMANNGQIGEARTVTLPLPPAVMTLVDQGLELGEANDQVFSTSNSKQHGGAYGLLTNDLYTRESVYTEALVMALVPFVNDLYPPQAGSD